MSFGKTLKASLKTGSANVSVGTFFANWAICHAAEDFHACVFACEDLSEAEKKEILKIAEKRVEAANQKVSSRMKWAEERGDE